MAFGPTQRNPINFATLILKCMSKAKKVVENFLKHTDIRIDGDRPWDLRVLDDRFYNRVVKDGDLGLGESYMEGMWDARELDSFFTKMLRAGLQHRYKYNLSLILYIAFSKVFNIQSKSRAFEVGEKHYDSGNKLFQAMLDDRMNYSCAYWQKGDTLKQAQERKLDLICRKLQLEAGMRVLDIGCGWGAFGKYAAEKYQVETVGITISKKQKELGEKLCKGLPVSFRLMDYREIDEKFDRIVSIGMIEHVGYKNYKTYFEIVRKSLHDDGLFLLHTIGSLKSYTTTSPWLNKYIFPNGMIPSLSQLSKAHELLLVLEDLHNIGVHYDKTLMSWYNNFEKAWPALKGAYHSDFYRMWKYYLLSCAGIFRSRYMQVWQMLFSKNGIPGGYTSVR